jgi:hypothetical protein
MKTKQLQVRGNKIVLLKDENVGVWLTGLNLGGSDWSRSLDAEHMPRQVDEIIQHWNVNVMRIPVSLRGWYGAIRLNKDDPGNAEGYRRGLRDYIEKFTQAGIYVIIDLHEFHYPKASGKFTSPFQRAEENKGEGVEYPGVPAFWKEIAEDEYYANHPGVMFGILNEHTYAVPDDVYKNWDIWRNGGVHHENGEIIIGHQQILDAIRDAGAKNIVAAGGLDWAYDLSGIAGAATDCGTSFALEDKTGYGVLYDSHIYPWKDEAGWDEKVGAARKLFPVLIGEVGYDPGDGTHKIHAPKKWDMTRHEEWSNMFFNFVKDKDGVYGGVPLHYTAWCFHTGASPRILADWDFTPTVYWGAHVKGQLAQRVY